jgi:hypothetical protein
MPEGLDGRVVAGGVDARRGGVRPCGGECDQLAT